MQRYLFKFEENNESTYKKLIILNSSTDRDKYVNINWNNIQPGRENNFQIASTSNKYRTVYDIKSIMHYTSFAFSRNNRPTITAKVSLINKKLTTIV